MLLQETKKTSIDRKCVSSLWGHQNKHWIFRFENMWFRHKDFKKNVQNRWSENNPSAWTGQRIQQKLQYIITQLKTWNKDTFAIIPQLKDKLGNETACLDAKASESGSSAGVFAP